MARGNLLWLSSSIVLLVSTLLASTTSLPMTISAESGIASVYAYAGELTANGETALPELADGGAPHLAVRHPGAGDQRCHRRLGLSAHQRSRPVRRRPHHRSHARGRAGDRLRRLGACVARRRRLERLISWSANFFAVKREVTASRFFTRSFSPRGGRGEKQSRSRGANARECCQTANAFRSSLRVKRSKPEQRIRAGLLRRFRSSQ